MQYDENIFLNAFKFASIGMALVSPSGTWLKVNGSLCELLGYPEKELLSKTFQDITHPEDIDEDLDYVQRMLDGTLNTYQMEKRYFHKEGHTIHVLLSVSLVHHPDGTPNFFISQIQDITRRKQLEEELTNLANEDFLTKVANRRYFIEHATREIVRGSRFNEPLALLMLDIDKFKAVNDKYGHDVGDKVLKATAECCKHAIREVDLFGRLGGEEFGALLISTDLRIAGIIAERIRKNVENLVIQTTKGDIRITISIGFTVFTGSEKSIEERMKLADEALYQAKDAGRNRVERVLDHDYEERGIAHEHMRSSFVNIEWKSEYRSGNNNIDKQHMQLFAVANDLLSAVMAGLVKDEIKAIAETLIIRTTRHFRDEELILNQIGYPFTAEHAKIHAALKEEMRTLLDRYASHQATVGQLFEFLAVRVIAEHVLHEDKKFFPYMTPR